MKLREWWINIFSMVVFPEPTPGRLLQLDPEIVHVVEYAAYAKAVKALKFYAEFKMNEDEMYRDEGNCAKRTLRELGELNE